MKKGNRQKGVLEQVQQLLRESDEEWQTMLSRLRKAMPHGRVAVVVAPPDPDDPSVSLRMGGWLIDLVRYRWDAEAEEHVIARLTPEELGTADHPDMVQPDDLLWQCETMGALTERVFAYLMEWCLGEPAFLERRATHHIRALVWILMAELRMDHDEMLKLIRLISADYVDEIEASVEAAREGGRAVDRVRLP